jgi:hypothetical protein
MAILVRRRCNCINTNINTSISYIIETKEFDLRLNTSMLGDINIEDKEL